MGLEDDTAKATCSSFPKKKIKRGTQRLVKHKKVFGLGVWGEGIGWGRAIILVRLCDKGVALFCFNLAHLTLLRPTPS